MCVNVCVCVCVCVSMWVCVYMCECVCVSLCMRAYECECLCLCVCVSMCVSVCECVSVCASVCVCVCECEYMSVCVLCLHILFRRTHLIGSFLPQTLLLLQVLVHFWLIASMVLTFRHRASCILGQAFHYSPENAFYIFNQQIYFIIWYLLDSASLI